ncbi:MAG: fibronectin type III domain-containing protein, partial [Actinomycetes bacterium]
LGFGASSLPSAAVTPVGKPDQPDAPAATPLSGAASVAFSAPSNDGGRGITGYVVGAYTENGAKVNTVSGAASPIRVTGLTNGTRYRFAVAAVNALGTSVESAQSTSVAPGPFPDQPLNVVAARDSGSPDQATVARVTFSSSSYYSPALIINGLDFEDSSQVLVVSDLTLGQQSTFADSQMCSGTGCGTRVTGLTPGHRYTFTVAARNRIGLGQVSAASAEFVAGIAPATPRVTSLAAGRDSTTVNFTDDTPSVAGLPIISYTVKVVDLTAGGAELKQVTKQASDVSGSGADKSLTVSGLTAGRSYGFLVRATNAVGAGSWSGEQLTATPAVEATAPDGVAAVPNDRSATVTWSAPRFNGGSAITGYRVTANPGGQTCDAGALALSCQIGGLTNGTIYTFTVVANNGVGAGAISAPSPVVTPASVPSAPTTVSAVKGEGSATISWAAPASDGGSPLIGYAVTADTGNGIAAPLACTITRLTADSTSCVFTGLTGGISYTFKVKAINGRGSSDWSTSTTPLTAGGRSSTSGYIQAERGDASALVSFGDASSNGSPITTYTVTASPGGNTCTVNQLQIAASVRSCTVEGLTNGQSYTFTVTPSNEFGEGASSGSSQAVVPAAAPSSPTDVTATPGMGSAMVSFTAAQANGSAVVEYRVVANDLTAPERGGQEANGTGTSLLVSNLVAGDTYTFTVTARNAVGTSSGAASAQAVPLAVPQAPTNVSATPGLGSASVSFDAATARGASIIGYTVTAAPGGQTCQATTQARSCTVPGLTNGSAYTFTVKATSSVGDGLSSGSSPPVIPVGPPAAPTDVETSPSDSQSVYVTFAAPASNGSPITGYTIFAKDLTDSGNWIEKASATTAVSTRVTGLTEGHDYSFKVRATNAVGEGPDSIDTAAASTATVPGQADPSAEAGDSSVRISLTPPAANGSAIRQYTVKVYAGSGAYTETGLLKQQTADAAPIEVGGLTNGT